MLVHQRIALSCQAVHSRDDDDASEEARQSRVYGLEGASKRRINRFDVLAKPIEHATWKSCQHEELEQGHVQDYLVVWCHGI